MGSGDERNVCGDDRTWKLARRAVPKAFVGMTMTSTKRSFRNREGTKVVRPLFVCAVHELLLITIKVNVLVFVKRLLMIRFY